MESTEPTEVPIYEIDIISQAHVGDEQLKFLQYQV
jgi:hypothetical protein